MLTLKEFLKETLTQIAEGVSEFDKEHGETGASSHPHVSGSVDAKTMATNGVFQTGWLEEGATGATMSYATLVDFDVAVTATDAEKAKAGGSIRVVSFLKAEGGLESETGSSSVSRVKFKLPLQLRSTNSGSV